MFKRILALLLCVLMLASVLPLSALASTETDNEAEAQRVRNEIIRMYYRVLANTGRSSLHGFCGLMASYQLWLLGINPYPLVYNGNGQFDAYKDMDVTLGGHRVKAYSAKDYSLEEALNTVSNNGTKNVYNILVGFQWTSTQEGRYYGHSMVINAIIDGKVYFSEGYGSEFNMNPGMPCVATIKQFADSYNAWTSFEGIIVFGRKEYTDFCTEYPAHLFVETTAPMHTLTIPSADEGENIRPVMPWERLEVTAVYENPQGELYYQVNDCGRVCYSPGTDTQAVCFNYGDITAPDANVPVELALSEDFWVSGHVLTRQNRLDGVKIQVSTVDGVPMISNTYTKNGKEMILDTWSVNNGLHFEELPRGEYTYSIYAYVDNHYIEHGGIHCIKTSVPVVSSNFTVDTQTSDIPVQSPAQHIENGWEYDNGSWRYFEDGVARTGWFCYKGIDYYLLDDGTAATGWHNINGKDRYFTSTGAMRTGWLETDEGTYYMLFNGQKATGERTINGDSFFFDENGLLTQQAQ